MSHKAYNFDRDCTARCKSKQHGECICAALSKRGVSDEELCAFMRWRCGSSSSVLDSVGRNALHVAASCGRRAVVEWLVRVKGANINAKDLESGYTPLHRSLFYGKINVAVSLIKHGAATAIMDNDCLTPVEQTMKDRLSRVEFTHSSPCEIYVWGTNSNDTLGTGSQQGRPLPELLDTFHKTYPNTFVKQVCLDKFHLVLVSTDGRVFTCGLGRGGRLGLSSERTVITPVNVQPFGSSGTVCIQASVGRDHSLFLTETGVVYSCGLNVHHVLGLEPPPERVLTPRPLKEFKQPIQGVCATRFHSLVWGPKALYTWGLHGGQLGQDINNKSKTVINPKMVSNLLVRNASITCVAASDGATVAVTDRGDIYALHEYQIRKIASRQLNITKVTVIGGHLNSKLDAETLLEKGGDELKVLALTNTGNILLWQESYPQLTRCIYSINRPMVVRDMIINRQNVLFVTRDGELFTGEVRPKKKKVSDGVIAEQKKSAFHEFLEKDECHYVKISKVPHVHRAVSIQSDMKGVNFAVLQTDPKYPLFEIPQISASEIQQDMLVLLQDADENDALHDTVFKVGLKKFSVHRYIIAANSEPLYSLIESNVDNPCIELANLNTEIFEQVLLYMYTGTCDLLTPGLCTVLAQKEIEDKKLDDTDLLENANKVSAFEYYGKNKSKKIAEVQKNVFNPLRMLNEAAKRFGMAKLQKKIECYAYRNGYIVRTEKKDVDSGVKFDRIGLTNLHDVVIKARNEKEFQAHKCILAARLEYFNNLFALRWNENSKRDTISLPLNPAVLEDVIDFLYTDESTVEKCEDIDHIYKLLIVADQLFIIRLKEMCEAALVSFLTLRNAAELFQFASIYNAAQLKRTCMEFLCLNLPAVLESRCLEVLDPELLDDLSNFYCEWNPLMSKRVLTPYSNAPNDETVKSISELFPVCFENDDSDRENQEKSTSKSSKKKSRPRKISSSESKMRQRTESTSSLTERDLNVCFEPVVLDKKDDTEWVKILNSQEKHRRIIQSRLKVIAAAKEEFENTQVQENYTKLVSNRTIPTAIPKVIDLVESPLSSPIFDNFPELNSPPSTHYIHDTAKSPRTDTPKQKARKMSQKERKKLAENSNASLGERLDKINIGNPWNKASSPTESFTLGEIVSKQQKQVKEPDTESFSPPKNPWQISPVNQLAKSPDTKNDFLDIIENEKKQKENWSKMRAKPLLYTQMEDKAIEELHRFYNTAEASDEHITIERVQKGTFAVPLWVAGSKAPISKQFTS